MSDASINLRGLSEELRSKLKVRAATEGVTLQSLCVRFLWWGLDTPIQVNPGKDVPAVGEEGRALAETARNILLEKRPHLTLNTGTEMSFDVSSDRRLRGVDSGIFQPLIEPSELVEAAMCPYKEYDEATGETYACGLLVHSPKVKHTRGKVVQ